MTEFQLALTEHFENHALDVYKNEQGEMEFTREQIGRILGYENPGNAISDIHRRNRKFLDRFSTTRNLRVVGKQRDVRTYGFKGFMAICRYSSQPIADRVMEFLIDLADRFRAGLHPSNPAQLHKLQYELNLLTVENENLADENLLLRRKLNMYKGGVGTFSLYDAAIHLMQNQLGDGNVNKLVQKMVKHGLLQKDQSVKKQTLYRPFLKDCRNGYFVARFDSSNDPIPVIQSNIVLTLDGLNWLAAEFQKIEGVEYVQHRPLIQHSPYTKYRLSLVNQMEPVLQ